jgi:steroid delta-isomerase-like uncharacterized protein
MKLKPVSFLLSLLVTQYIFCTQFDPTKEYQPLLDEYLTFWNSGNFDGIEEVLHTAFELRMTPKYEPEKGIELFKENVIQLRKAYPDFMVHVDEIIWNDNAVAVRWTITATNSGEGLHPPTGKSINVPGMSIFHFIEGKIKDEWIASNNGYWRQQLGFRIVSPFEK